MLIVQKCAVAYIPPSEGVLVVQNNRFPYHPWMISCMQKAMPSEGLPFTSSIDDVARTKSYAHCSHIQGVHVQKCSPPWDVRHPSRFSHPLLSLLHHSKIQHSPASCFPKKCSAQPAHTRPSHGSSSLNCRGIAVPGITGICFTCP